MVGGLLTIGGGGGGGGGPRQENSGPWPSSLECCKVPRATLLEGEGPCFCDKVLFGRQTQTHHRAIASHAQPGPGGPRYQEVPLPMSPNNRRTLDEMAPKQTPAHANHPSRASQSTRSVLVRFDDAVLVPSRARDFCS